MAGLDIRQKLHQQIDQLLPEQLNLLAEFLDFLQFKKTKPIDADNLIIERKPNLHLGAFVISDEFDDPLPDSFWLGEE
ncbi:MAG: hypothetical protein WA949_23450 [Phormidesmis sp.]